MKINRNIIKCDEKAIFELRSLYQGYGFAQYKMGKFEEYDLYVKNRDFITSDSIITFNDANGKLMALKPDATLSIVKNYHHIPGYVQKVYYSENIYRVSESTHTFKEILQTGLEAIGDIDVYNICEVTMLAVKSLMTISTECVLDISHLGVISAILDTIDVDEEVRDSIIKCMSEKNTHELRKICSENDIDEKTYQIIKALVSTYGNPKKVLNKLKTFELTGEAVASLNELEIICEVLLENKLISHVNIDFSIVNDMKYYNGVLFKGFVEGIPTSILSGGQYDRLMHRMGKKAGAIGFAVYLDSLERLDKNGKNYDVDVVFLYDDLDDIIQINRVSKGIIELGQTVLVEKAIPEKLKYKKLVKLMNGEVITLEDNN